MLRWVGLKVTKEVNKHKNKKNIYCYKNVMVIQALLIEVVILK